MMKSLVYDVINISKKEFAEQKKSIMKMVPLMLLCTLPAVAATLSNAYEILVPMWVVVRILPVLIGSSCAFELIKGNLTTERREQTLDILLISKVNPIALVISKVLPGVIIASALSYLNTSIFLWNTVYRQFFQWELLVIIPFIVYILSVFSSLISFLMKDDKAGNLYSILVMIIIAVPLVYVVNIVSIVLCALLCVILTWIMAFCLRNGR